MRRNSTFRAIIIGFLCLLFSSLSAQNVSTEGVHFWLTFLNQNDPSSVTSLIITAKQATSGTITNPATNWSTNFNVPANGQININIPLVQGLTQNIELTTSCGILVTANDTISLYAANFFDYSFDVTNVLPTPALGSDYIIQTYSGGDWWSNFAIVATENNTVIDITPSITTYTGYAANSTFSVTLNRGQVYAVYSYLESGNLSGTTVSARDCKKIAIFQGCMCTNVPNPIYGYCDHIIEQCFPTFCWGKDFILTNSMTRTNDRARVTASVNGTQVYRNGVLMTTLNANASYEFEITSYQPTAYINATQPVAVNMYLTGSEYGGGTGDPSMVWVSPLEQRIQQITFGTFQPGQTLNQYVNVIVPTTGVSSVQLDGINIGGQFTTVPQNPAYSYIRRNITHGSHTLRCDSGLIAHVYGLGADESYAYSAGSSAANLKDRMSINNVNSVDIAANQEYCIGDTILFTAELGAPYDGVRWDFGDGNSASALSVYHAYEQFGVYDVFLLIDRRSYGNNCGGFDTIRSVIRILQNEITVYDTICQSETYNQDGFYLQNVQRDTIVTKTFPTVWGCDSIVHLRLNVIETEPERISATVCPDSPYVANGFDIPGAAPGTYTHIISSPSSAGCENSTILTLTVLPYPTPSLGSDRILCSLNDFPLALTPSGSYATYLWNTGETSETLIVNSDGDYWVDVATAEGCTGNDSIHIETHEVTVSIEALSDNFCETYEMTLNAVSNMDNLRWSTGETTATIIARQSGTITVVASDGNCESVDQIYIEPCPFDIFIPNAFTPSAPEGKNDYFFISGTLEELTEFEIYIFDRWGEMVFNSKNPHFRWDGKVGGKVANSNVFSYVIKLKTIFGDRKVLNGTITVL